MPTKIWGRITRRASALQTADKFAYDTNTASGTTLDTMVFPVSAGNTNRVFVVSSGTPGAFVSERIAADVTISGDMTWVSSVTQSPTATVVSGVRVSKITTSGSVITLLGEAHGTALVNGTGQTVTVPVPTPITLYVGERVLMEPYVIVGPGQTMSADLTTMSFGFTGASEASLTFAETVTFTPNGTVFWFRREANSGISTFKNLLPTQGSTAMTEITTNTVPAATELPFTETPAGPLTATNSAAFVADTGNVATYASPSFTPIANRLYLLAVVHSDTAPETTIPTIATTTGLAFVQVDTVVFDTTTSNLQRLTLFRAMKPSGLAAGTYTVTLADAGTGCLANLTEINGVVTTGSDGADAIRNIVTTNANATANPSVTLGAINNQNNGVFGCFGLDIATVPTVGTGFTSLRHGTIATPTSGLLTEWRWGNVTSVPITVASSDWAAIAVELVATAPGVQAAWITPRFAKGFRMDMLEGGLEAAFPLVYAKHSSSSASGIRMKLYRYRNGDETHVMTLSSHNTSFSTVYQQVSLGGVTDDYVLNPTDFLPDDRLLIRLYLRPQGVATMTGGRTVSFGYDHNVAGTTGNSVITVYNVPPLKAETDPASVPPPNNLSTMGLGS